MKANLSGLDRWIRLIIGIIILSLLVFLHGGLRYLGLIGLIPLVTAAIGYCPLYAIFGIRTGGPAKK